MKVTRLLLLIILSILLIEPGKEVSAQTAFVQRLDLGLDSKRNLLTDWLLKQGFDVDPESQESTRIMAQGIGTVMGTTYYGECYLNKSGNIRVRIFTDTLFIIKQVQAHLDNPVKDEADQIITSLKTLGYKEVSNYKNTSENTFNWILEKEKRRFFIIRPADGKYLLVKGSYTGI